MGSHEPPRLLDAQQLAKYSWGDLGVKVHVWVMDNFVRDVSEVLRVTPPSHTATKRYEILDRKRSSLEDNEFRPFNITIPNKPSNQRRFAAFSNHNRSLRTNPFRSINFHTLRILDIFHKTHKIIMAAKCATATSIGRRGTKCWGFFWTQ